MTRHPIRYILLAATLAAMPQLAVARDSTPEVDSLGIIDGWLQQHKFEATDVTSDSLGVSVAVAGDTAVVGAPLATAGGNDFAGAAFVFDRSGDTWTPQGRLIALDPEESAQLGFAVALTEDGNTALVGAPFDDADGNDNQGAVYVFSRGADGWFQQQKFTASDEEFVLQFGVSVALSGDTALVGANFADVEGTPHGAAYVFTRGTDGWQQQRKLFADDGAANDQFGASVALAGDTALVGAPFAEVDGNPIQGAAYVFTRSGETWSPQTKLAANDDAGDQFGISVALAGDTALVGAPNTVGDPGSSQGAAYVFTRDGGDWSPQATLFALLGNTNDNFGIAAALAGDGNTALVGADEEGEGTGNVWTRAGQEWTPRARLIADDGEDGDRLGSSVALSGDTAVVGAPLAEVGSNQGAAYVFLPILSPAALEVDFAPLASSDGNDIFEPGEQVEIAPGWRNNDAAETFGDGILSNFTGPEGGTYEIVRNGVSYGPIAPGEIGSCRDSGSCYQLDVQMTGPDRPASHWDATVVEELDVGADHPLPHTWPLHLGDSFEDVARDHLFYSFIETLIHHEVTSGCAATAYCPGDPNTRAQMAVFVLKSLEGPEFLPPACEEGSGSFDDVPSDNPFCPWIEELANRGVVSGCDENNYCPGDSITRAQMAIFLLRTLEGADYTPPECTGVFTDVECPSLFADWIEDLAAREITSGCNESEYCPGDPQTRSQMGAFLTRTFGLLLYGP